MDADRDGSGCGDSDLRALGMDWEGTNDGGKVRGERRLESAVTVTADGDAQRAQGIDVKVFEACHCAIGHVRDVLDGTMVVVLLVLGQVGVGLFIEFPVVADSAGPAPEVAGDTGGVAAPAPERPAVQAAAGHLRLAETAVGRAFELFGAGLAGIRVPVRLAVVEDIPVAVQLHHPSVGVAQVVGGAVLVRVSVQVQVALVHQRTAEAEFSVRAVADRVAQLVVVGGGIDKHVFAVDLADGRGLEELMPFEIRRWIVRFEGKQQFRSGLDRKHVLFQLQHHAAALPVPAETAERGGHLRLETRVQVHAAVIVGQHAGVKGKLVAFPPPPDGAVWVMDVAIEPVLPIRRIAHRNTHHAQEIVGVVQVIPPVRTDRHVRREQDAQAQPVHGVLVLAVDHA